MNRAKFIDGSDEDEDEDEDEDSTDSDDITGKTILPDHDIHYTKDILLRDLAKIMEAYPYDSDSSPENTGHQPDGRRSRSRSRDCID